MCVIRLVYSNISVVGIVLDFYYLYRQLSGQKAKPNQNKMDASSII